MLNMKGSKEAGYKSTAQVQAVAFQDLNKNNGKYKAKRNKGLKKILRGRVESRGYFFKKEKINVFCGSFVGQRIK